MCGGGSSRGQEGMAGVVEETEPIAAQGQPKPGEKRDEVLGFHRGITFSTHVRARSLMAFSACYCWRLLVLAAASGFLCGSLHGPDVAACIGLFCS